MSDDSEPSQTGLNGEGRDARGRFGRGNKSGRGNPIHAKQARIRAALFSSVKAADIRAVVAALVGRARSGDVPACRELLDRLCGRPGLADPVNPLGDAMPRTIEFFTVGPDDIADAPADGDGEPSPV